VKIASIVRERDGAVVCARCTIADSPARRMRGLLFRSGLAADEGLLLRPAPSVQTFFMRFAIDIVFLDKAGSVVGIRREVKPARVVWCRRARATLELAAGQADHSGISIGDVLTLRTESSVVETGKGVQKLDGSRLS
jgi:uncharacterized membrane protein (UPF0127 family)